MKTSWEKPSVSPNLPSIMEATIRAVLTKEERIVLTNENQIHTRHDPTFPGEAGLPEPIFENGRETFKVILYSQKEKETPPEKKNVSEEKALLSFCKTPRNAKEIADFLGISNSAYSTATRIKPLIEKGLPKKTLPSKKKSKFQKYYAA